MEDSILIAGLGNPGPKYEDTRHNVGFMAVDQLAQKANPFTNWQEKFNAHHSSINFCRKKIILLKPQTFMNRSGISLSKAASFFKINASQILIIHDDIDLEYGIVRLKSGGGTGGHNGLNSCRQYLGSPDFQRLRIGVGRPKFGDVSDYVLGRFIDDEKATLDDILTQAVLAVECFLDSGITIAMNNFNKR